MVTSAKLLPATNCNSNMKTPTTYATRSQLMDYVTKGDFTEFKEEMRDFRDDAEKRFTSIDSKLRTIDDRFDSIDKRLSIHDRRFDTLEDTIRRSIGLMHEQFREDLKIGIEYFQNVDNKKVDIKDFEALKIKVEAIMAK